MVIREKQIRTTRTRQVLHSEWISRVQSHANTEALGQRALCTAGRWGARSRRLGRRLRHSSTTGTRRPRPAAELGSLCSRDEELLRAPVFIWSPNKRRVRVGNAGNWAGPWRDRGLLQLTNHVDLENCVTSRSPSQGRSRASSALASSAPLRLSHRWPPPGAVVLRPAPGACCPSPGEGPGPATDCGLYNFFLKVH